MSLHENIRTEPVSELPLRKAITVDPASSVREAITEMRQKRLGCAIVVDTEDKPIGMFTETMLDRLLLEGSCQLDELIEVHMAQQVSCVKTSDPIVMVLDAMQSRDVRFVCVVNENGRVVGLTGQKGLMEYIAEHFSREVMVQRVGSSPYPRQREGA